MKRMFLAIIGLSMMFDLSAQKKVLTMEEAGRVSFISPVQVYSMARRQESVDLSGPGRFDG